jgi:predicted short-subunit dehydrogenase-like oxidoreductase (DUF2520 family)
VPDDVITSVAQEIADQTENLTGKSVVHTSGAHSIKTLAALTGARLGSLHPALPFADVETAAKAVHGVTFALETDDEILQQQLTYLVYLLNGRIIHVPTEKKALYHAALVFASNYTVTLYNMAEQLLASFSDDDKAITGALNTLILATVQNLQAKGTPAALTGPLVRGDVGTIAAHLQALGQFDDRFVEGYAMLARQTYNMLEQRGVNTQHIEQTLRQDTHHGTADDS